MQPPPRYDSPEPSKIRPAKPRTRKSKAELLIEILTSVRFWGGLSVLVALVSLVLPWWGVTVGPSTASTSWGLFFSSQSQQQTNVIFFQDRLDAALAANYSLMTSLVLLTALATIIGAILKRTLILTISLILSVATILSYLADVGSAVSGECAHNLVFDVIPTSCISGLVGQGTSGVNLVTWGFQAGFYAFVASAILLLTTLALQAAKPRESWPLSGVR